MAQPPADNLSELLAPVAERMEPAIGEWLADPAVPASLTEAMRYCVLGGGKRMRAALVLFATEAAGTQDGAVDPLPAAVAAEMVHAYSLVHDDLPAMDDDTLRRGRPTAHVRFGEAMAILAGDALLTRAFEVLATSGGDGAVAAALAAELAAGAGAAGMIAGQVADMDLCELPGGVEGVRYIHRRKTAALCRAAVRMGGLCGAADADTVDALGRAGELMGLAFQVTDDLLDATAAAEELGKTPGKDAQAGKRTYLAEMDPAAAAAEVRRLTDQAREALDALPGDATRLRRLAELLAGRDR